MDDDIVQKTVLLPIFSVHFNVHSLGSSFKITENTLRNGGCRLYFGNIPPQVEHFLFRFWNHIIGKKEGHQSKKEHKNNQAPHPSLQGYTWCFHGRKLIVFRESTKGKDGGEEYRKGQHLVDQSGNKIENKLTNNDHAQSLSCQVIDEQPYPLKNEYDDQDEKGTEEVV